MLEHSNIFVKRRREPELILWMLICLKPFVIYLLIIFCSNKFIYSFNLIFINDKLFKEKVMRRQMMSGRINEVYGNLQKKVYQYSQYYHKQPAKRILPKTTVFQRQYALPFQQGFVVNTAGWMLVTHFKRQILQETVLAVDVIW